MGDVIEKAVERVILAMRDNLGEQITIDDMARTAMFSKFHFSRIFQRVTGISPGRFLSALRLAEAKRLLLTTSMTVADISHMVGYNSIGTFSSRFRGSVGVSPTEYRQYRGLVAPLAERGTGGGDAVVRGHVWQVPGCRPGPVVVGLFGDRIAQGTPVAHVTLPGAGPFELAGVPAGTWHILAHSVEVGSADAVGEPYVAAFGPLEIAPAAQPRGSDLWLRPRRVFDPPTLLAQLDEAVWTTPVPVAAPVATVPIRVTTQDMAPGRAEHAALPGV